MPAPAFPVTWCPGNSSRLAVPVGLKSIRNLICHAFMVFYQK